VGQIKKNLASDLEAELNWSVLSLFELPSHSSYYYHELNRARDLRNISPLPWTDRLMILLILLYFVQLERCLRNIIRSCVWWYMPVISAIWEMEIGRVVV
jgi:hypothetical protein